MISQRRRAQPRAPPAPKRGVALGNAQWASSPPRAPRKFTGQVEFVLKFMTMASEAQIADVARLCHVDVPLTVRLMMLLGEATIAIDSSGVRT